MALAKLEAMAVKLKPYGYRAIACCADVTCATINQAVATPQRSP